MAGGAGVFNPGGALLYARYLWMMDQGINAGPRPFGTVGRVYLTPIDVPWPVIIDRIIVFVGNTSAGNMRLGLYREGATADSPVGAELVAETASVAQIATRSVQMVAVPDTVVTPGQYFVGMQGDNVAGTLYNWDDNASVLAFFYDRGGGYGAFTDPCPALTVSTSIYKVALRVKENLLASR